MGRSAGKKPPLSATCDNRNFYSSAQAAAYLRLDLQTLRQLSSRGALTPGKAGREVIYTRADLDRYRALEKEREIAAQLVAGVHPLDLYLEGRGKFSLREVCRVMLEWSRLSGVWLVEGPRGSYARWLERLEIQRCTPRELRRIVEHLIADPQVGARVRALFSDQRKAPVRVAQT